MKKSKYYRLGIFLVLFAVFQIGLANYANAQESAEAKPEMSVIGIELGDRESAKKFLIDGFHPKVEEDGRASYYFYNRWGSQVMRLTAPSVEDKYFITEIEVYRVSKKYRTRHYQAKETKYFETENGIFIGFKQSAMYFLAAIENAGAINRYKIKNVINLKGEPDEHNKTDKKRETLQYKISDVKLSDGKTNVDYEATYKFYKNNLRGFTIKILPKEENLAKEKKKKTNL